MKYTKLSLCIYKTKEFNNLVDEMNNIDDLYVRCHVLNLVAQVANYQVMESIDKIL
jgi:hypothetical protein